MWSRVGSRRGPGGGGIKLLPIQPMQLAPKMDPNKLFLGKRVSKNELQNLILEENLYNKICSVRFRPPEPLKHINFEENGLLNKSN